MNPQEQALLQQLNDVALPASPGWWPPAPGWWLVLFIVLLLLFFIYRLINRQSTRKSENEWRWSALDEHQRLSELSGAYENQTGENQAGLIAQLSVLMRRVALAVEPRSHIASLTDDEWLAKLDAIGTTTEYSEGAGRVLYRHQYQRSNPLDANALQDLFRLTADTIKKASIDVPHTEGTPVAAL